MYLSINYISSKTKDFENSDVVVFSQMFVWKTFSFLDLIVTDIFITSFKKTPNVKLYIYPIITPI